jgi:N-methylhydantoinase A
MPEQRLRLSVDIGGTFTDVVLDRGTSRLSTKVLTTHQAPELGLMEGACMLIEQAGTTWANIDLFLHGTTLATNAIIERRGARTALLTTQGFRDTIEIGTESRHDQYDIFLKKPVPLVPRDLRFSVAERMNVHGDVLLELDENQVEERVEQMTAQGVESLAISYIHAYANGDHEQRTRDIVARLLPKLSISLSSEVCPEVREYERASTTCANAYVRPVMASYLGRLEQQLKERGLRCPILLMSSGGGLTTIEQASSFPIRLVESGPAGGAILAAKVASECGLNEIVSFDMGGTTAKLCLIDDSKPLKSRTFEVDRTERFLKGSGLPVRIPVIEMVEIGAGGGSIARVDDLGRVAVGPESASSEPGPAAYGRGGTRPTVSDADVVLGRLDPQRFAGGKLQLQPDLARAALLKEIGDKLSLDPTMSALAVSEMVEENMANASRVHAAEFGKDLRRRALIAFGGAAPLHAARLASKLGLEKVIIPRGAGVGSAIGFLEAPVAYEVVRSRHVLLAALDAQEIDQLFEPMVEEAVKVVKPASNGLRIRIKRSAFMRYVGQGHELEVEMPEGGLTDKLRADLKLAFAQTYERIFGRALKDHAVEIITWAATATVENPPQSEVLPFGTDTRDDPRVGWCDLYDPDNAATTQSPVYWRDYLRQGVNVEGPAIIAEEETSTVVTSAFSASINELGHIVLTRRAQA